jgi:hypothetical protein
VPVWPAFFLQGAPLWASTQLINWEAVRHTLPEAEYLGCHLSVNNHHFQYLKTSALNQTIRLPKETAPISGQGRAHDFPGNLFTSHGRCWDENVNQRSSTQGNVFCIIHETVKLLQNSASFGIRKRTTYLQAWMVVNLEKVSTYGIKVTKGTIRQFYVVP